MKLYEITIKPHSGLGTLLKGDTLFGHFCWQAAYHPDLITDGLETALKVYETEPFAIFSSAVPKIPGDPPQYILKRPDLPLHMLFKSSQNRDRTVYYQNIKEQKNCKWMIFDGKLPIRPEYSVFWSDQHLSEALLNLSTDKNAYNATVSTGPKLWAWFEQPHNTINRITGTTGKGAFAPYNAQNLYYSPEVQLSVFILLNERWTDIDRIKGAMAAIGRFGFGRDASTGMGRFAVVACQELPLNLPAESEGLYTLGPIVLKDRDMAARLRFSPFTRFGRHGDRLAVSRNPFKTPVIMADEGAVLLPNLKTPVTKPYVGCAVGGLSKVQPEAVMQGYAPYLPIKLEKNDE